MLLRIVAAVAGLGPVLAGFLVPRAGLATAGAVALGCLGLVVVAASSRKGLAAVGILLAVAAGLAAPATRDLLPLTGLGAGVATVDLREAAFPEPPPKHIRVRGWLRSQWLLDEYAVADGARPNQSVAAPAVLVPFVGATDDVVSLRGAMVVARVPGGVALDPNLTTIEGTVTPLPDALLGALVAVAQPTRDPTGPPLNAEIRGVLVDTLDAPRPAEAWTRLVLVAGLALAALGCLWIAAARPRGA